MTLLPSSRALPITRRPARLIRAILITSVLAGGLAVPGVALANGDAVIADCAPDEQLSRTYTQAEYKDALAHIPADVDQYTSCRDVIRRAQLKAAGVGGGGSVGGGGGGGSAGGGGGGAGAPGGPTGASSLNAVDTAIAAATPAERTALTKAMSGSGPVTVGGRDLSPAGLQRGDLSSSTSIPAPLIAVLILLALGTIAALTPTLLELVRSRRHGPLT